MVEVRKWDAESATDRWVVLARDALSQPVASTPSLGYTGLIARAAPQTLSLALR